MRKTHLLGLLLGALSGEAWASDPLSVYCDPRRVELLPTEAAATRIVIHGSFTRLKGDGTYTPAECGYMYFECQVGQEALCRMQWKEIRDNFQGDQECAGFGQRDMAATARVHAEGTPLGTPDRWELGLGVRPAVSLGGRCPEVKALVCAEAPDMAGADLAAGPGPQPDLRGPATPPSSGGCSMGAAGTLGAGGLPALLLGLGLLLRRRRRG